MSSRLDNVTDNMTVDDAIRLNREWSTNDNNNLFAPTCVYENPGAPLGWCRHTGLPKSGKYKLAIIGNSWTANHARLFYEECGSKAWSLLQGSAWGCEPLYPTDQSDMCRKNFTDFEKRLRIEKPDYAFIFTRFISIGDPIPPNITTFDQDPIYQTMKTQMLKFISNIKFKLYMLDAIPEVFAKVILEIAPLVKDKVDPKKIDELLVNPSEKYLMARRRHAQLMKDCKGKCVLVDYIPQFFNTSSGTFRYFDERGFSYWTTPLHLSPHGIEHLRNVWKGICGSIF